jgi:acyl-CoA thioester hydrolase
MVKITKIRARYEESDQMGFIHHSNHIVWMELARMNLFRECGINYRELETKGYILPVTKVVTKYVSPAYFDDEIEIHAAFSRISYAKIRADYLIFRNENDLLCYGYTEHCFLTKEAKRPVRIPEGVYEKLKLSKTVMSWKTNSM